ncbi:MAG: PepSY domain-containing protein [Solirubrobacterales bacterium]|nr:PepSY domain-containing protein [Solirubrobacterales bacterium]
MPQLNRKLTAVATALALTGGGAVAATAATTTSGAKAGNPAEKPLTGDTAAKVRAAALEKVPGGTVLRVETDEGGVYEAHVRKSDGTEVEVKVGKDFAVTSVETRPAGRGGPGGHGPRFDTAALAKSLGVTEARLQAALQATRPDEGGDRNTEMAAAIAKSLGGDATAAKVADVLDANRPDRSASHDRGADRTAPAAALAKTFGVTEARAQAALDAAHDAKHDDLAAALAEELGLGTAKVQAALDAQRP